MSVKIIAELCQNHNGDMSILEEMVKQCAEAGAWACKIQTIFADMLQDKPELNAARPYEAEYARLKKLELNWEQQGRFVVLCRKYGVMSMTSCFVPRMLDDIKKIGYDFVKIPGYLSDDAGFVDQVFAKFGYRVVVSTSGSAVAARRAASWVGPSHAVLLHCVSKYPMQLHEANFGRMLWLSNFTENWGFSDHSQGGSLMASKMAIHLGARYLERHVTILPPDQTKDGPISITPDKISELIVFAQIPHNLRTPLFSEMRETGFSLDGINDDTLLPYLRGRFA